MHVEAVGVVVAFGPGDDVGGSEQGGVGDAGHSRNDRSNISAARRERCPDRRAEQRDARLQWCGVDRRCVCGTALAERRAGSRRADRRARRPHKVGATMRRRRLRDRGRRMPTSPDQIPTRHLGDRRSGTRGRGVMHLRSRFRPSPWSRRNAASHFLYPVQSESRCRTSPSPPPYGPQNPADFRRRSWRSRDARLRRR